MVIRTSTGALPQWSSPGLIDPGLTFFIVRTELATVLELHRNSVNFARLAVIGCDGWLGGLQTVEMIVAQGISSDLNDVNDCRVDLMLGRCFGTGGYGARQGQVARVVRVVRGLFQIHPSLCGVHTDSARFFPSQSLWYLFWDHLGIEGYKPHIKQLSKLNSCRLLCIRLSKKMHTWLYTSNELDKSQFQSRFATTFGGSLTQPSSHPAASFRGRCPTTGWVTSSKRPFSWSFNVPWTVDHVTYQGWDQTEDP